MRGIPVPLDPPGSLEEWLSFSQSTLVATSVLISLMRRESHEAETQTIQAHIYFLKRYYFKSSRVRRSCGLLPAPESTWLSQACERLNGTPRSEHCLLGLNDPGIDDRAVRGVYGMLLRRPWHRANTNRQRIRARTYCSSNSFAFFSDRHTKTLCAAVFINSAYI